MTATDVTSQDKQARNGRVQNRYDELMAAGKHGHYETLFRVVGEEVERALSQGTRQAEPVALLTDAEIERIERQSMERTEHGVKLNALEFARKVIAASAPALQAGQVEAAGNFPFRMDELLWQHLRYDVGNCTSENFDAFCAAVAALAPTHERAAPAPELNYARTLATSLFESHYSRDPHYASGEVKWEPCADILGLLTQIDNMAAGLVRAKASPSQPVAAEGVRWDAVVKLAHLLDDAAQGITERQAYDFASRFRLLAGLDGPEEVAAQVAALSGSAESKGIAASQDSAKGGKASDTMIDVAKRNLRAYLSKASFASNVDREAALNCVDVLVQATEQSAQGDK